MRNGSIAVAGAQVASTPIVSRAVFLSHTSRCSVKFSSARGGVGEGAGARGLQSGAVAMCSSARVGGGEGAGACSFTNFGRPGALLGSSVAFGSGCG